MSDSGDELYVGYQPTAPPTVARQVRRIVVALMLLAGGLALGVALGQAPFGPGTFEFGTDSTLEGTLILRPYPALRILRPYSSEASLILLTRFGKQAATPDPELEGRLVRAHGSLIHRGKRTMLELDDQPLEALGPGVMPEDETIGQITVQGEIVDSKCWLGVMKPNQGTSHRACATLCIRGGVPPMLRAVDAEGRVETFLLVDPEGAPIGDRILDRIAVPVEVSGRLSRLGQETWVLAVDPRAITRWVSYRR